MITIDGSYKSGSGTFVRDIVPLSILSGEPVKVVNIRAKRDRPGLRPQHLKAIQAASGMCKGRLRGDQVGSREISFAPGEQISGGKYHWDIGTAGSASLLTMCVLPLALYADRICEFDVVGGLFQDHAPSVFHLKYVLFPLLARMGIEADLEIIRPGYVPRGLGHIRVRVTPLKSPPLALQLKEQGSIRSIKGVALSSHLRERKVSSRMASACSNELFSKGNSASFDIKHDTLSHPAFKEPSVQPGAALAIRANTSTGCIIGADMAGARGRPAEFIGRETARHLLEDLSGGATVDRFCADQLIPFAALACGVSEFIIPSLTEHVDSRLWLVNTILGTTFELEASRLKIKGKAYERQ